MRGARAADGTGGVRAERGAMAEDGARAKRGARAAGAMRPGRTAEAPARRLDRRALGVLMRCALRFAVGFVLAQGKVLGQATPFGVAFAAATGAEGAAGVCGAAGAAFGALVAWRLGDGLKYVAAAALALVAVKAFTGTALSDTRFFRVVIAAASLAVVGFVFVAAEGFSLVATAVYIAETTLAGGAALVIPDALNAPEGEQTTRRRSLRDASRLLFAALLLLGLSGVPLFAGMAVGRIAATVLVAAAGAGGGMGAGAAAGVALGMVFDFGGGGGFYTMCYGVGGLLAGMAGGGSRMYAAFAYIAAAAIAALVDGAHFSVLYETFIATVLFMLVPEGRLRLVDFLAPDEVGSTREFERRELAAYHRAIGELFSETAQSLAPAAPAGVSPDRVVLRTAARVCRGCALRAVCWEREREETLALLRGTYPKVSSRGGAAESDLPPSFRARCLRTEDFCAALGEEHRVGQLERRRASEDARRRSTAAVLMRDAAALMDDADDPDEAPGFDGAAQRTARRALLAAGCAADLTACRLPGGRLCVELKTLRLAPAAREAMERALGLHFDEPVETEDGGLLLCERGRVRISASAATRRKRGSSRNGDCGTYFKAPRGRFCCLLADGMGSGEEAADEAARTVRQAERLVGAGVAALHVAELVHDLAAERASDVFSTLDLLVADDWAERGELVKLGAAPTYLRAKGRAIRVDGAPSPMVAGVRPKRVALDLSSCDLILMVTDGVCDGDDEWLKKLVERHEGGAEQLVRAAVAEASRRTGCADDMTAVALALER